MNSETGDMMSLPDGMEPPKGFTKLPATGEVLIIRGCNFVVESYDVEEKKMVLRAITKSEATSMLMGN